MARIRRAARTRRVGHAGTLDPFATGVLVVCVGRATRLMQYLVGLDKQYLATVRFGYATDSQDLTGIRITPLKSSKELSIDQVKNMLTEFTGPQSQLPPMFSAKKIAGERLYRAAREGRQIEREPSPINVRSMELIDALDPNEDGTRDFMIRVRCSSGTYIRTLAHDIGERLEIGAHLSALRRTAVGHFSIERALTLDEVERIGQEDGLEGELASPADTLAHLPLVRLDENSLRLITNGREIRLSLDEERASPLDGPVRLCDEAGRLIAVGAYDSKLETVKPKVVLAAEI